MLENPSLAKSFQNRLAEDKCVFKLKFGSTLMIGESFCGTCLPVNSLHAYLLASSVLNASRVSVFGFVFCFCLFASCLITRQGREIARWNFFLADIFQNGLAEDKCVFKLTFDSTLMIGESVFGKSLPQQDSPKRNFPTLPCKFAHPKKQQNGHRTCF